MNREILALRYTPLMLGKCPNLLLAFAGATLLYAGQAWAAPPEIENYCWAKASQIWFNGRGDREHFIANCIADLTPPPAKRSRNKNPQ